MNRPYCAVDGVELWLGDARELRAWAAAAVLVFDPPYGQRYRAPTIGTRRGARRPVEKTIVGDTDTGLRDELLDIWGTRKLAVCFGSLGLAPPPHTKQTLVYAKPPGSGTHGGTAGFRRDAEAIWLVGPWPASPLGGRTSIIRTGARGAATAATRYGHPHAKPVDVCELLLANCPPGLVGDPTAGAGSILVAARNLGRPAIGVEIDPEYCQRTAERLAEPVLITGHVGDPPELYEEPELELELALEEVAS